MNSRQREVLLEALKACLDTSFCVVGDGVLAGQFHDAGLLDERIFQVGSVTLGPDF